MNHKAAYDAYIRLVLQRMEEGVAPWHRPWASPQPPSNLVTRRPYRGSNLLMLGVAATQKQSPWFLTYRQADERGGQVRRGAKGFPVVYWKVGVREVEDEEGVLETRRSFLSRVHHVFSVSDVDGIEHLIPQPPKRSLAPHAEADRLVAMMEQPPIIEHGHPAAYYIPSRDVVGLPDRHLFASEPDFQATRFHELVHATGHPSRLNRDTLTQAAPFGSYTYSREELVAEMGAGMLCSLLGLANRVVDQNAAYLTSWVAGLRKDPHALVWAANRAQEAVDRVAGPWLKTQTAATPETPPLLAPLPSAG